MGKRRFLRFIGTTALSAAAIYGINAYINMKATEKKLLQADAEDFVDWNGLRVYCKKEGEGEPVVLLHHVDPACSAEDWRELMPLLSEKYTVYAVDLPGCGRSDKPDVTYTNFYYVQFLLDFIKNVVGRRARVIAVGDACPIALMAGVYDASKIEALHFVAPPSVEACAELPTQKTRLFKTLLSLPLIGRLVYNFLYSRDAIDSTLCEKYFYNPFLVDSDLVSRFHEAAHLQEEGGRFLAASLLGNYVKISIDHALRSLQLPASVLVSLPTEESAPVHSWTALRSDFALDGIAKASLLMPLEQADAVCDVLLAQMEGAEK